MNLNQKHLTRICSGLAVIFAASTALQTQAHPGHGVFEKGLSHAVMSPYHVMTLALCGSVLWAFGYAAKAPKLKFALKSAGIAALVGAVLSVGFAG